MALHQVQGLEHLRLRSPIVAVEVVDLRERRWICAVGPSTCIAENPEIRIPRAVPQAGTEVLEPGGSSTQFCPGRPPICRSFFHRDIHDAGLGVPVLSTKAARDDLNLLDSAHDGVEGRAAAQGIHDSHALQTVQFLVITAAAEMTVAHVRRKRQRVCDPLDPGHMHDLFRAPDLARGGLLTLDIRTGRRNDDLGTFDG